ncbi:uncharacterized protein [Lolium perenne]|uniref:uncharacterized protein n=1 Tax=Lolium perenne TaxID=4522 RepID=UPI0021F5D2C4|nr:uncharacterized protein LOC127346910 [Lolium perenne]
MNNFFNIVPALSKHYLKPPNPAQVHPKIRNNPRYFPYFQNCLGAIGGTHVPMNINGDIATPFRNRKGTLSQNVMVVCDFDGNARQWWARASWNADLEKALVDLLHEHNTPQYRGQNGWSTNVWNRITKKFHDNHPYRNYTKGQIQDKENELKREYKMLKEARQQSGVSWNEKRCMIEADPELWDNLIISFPKIGKFRSNKAFPLFDALGELYDGHLAEGNYNFTSTEPTQHTQVEVNPEVNSVEATHSHHDIVETLVDDTQGGMQEASMMENFVGNGEAQPTVPTAPSTSTENKPKKRRSNGDIAAMMEKYIEIKTKQVESKQIADVDEYSIKNCVARLNTMGLSREEKVKALQVFKNADNRELFICVDMDTALMWLQGEMA